MKIWKRILFCIATILLGGFTSIYVYLSIMLTAGPKYIANTAAILGPLTIILICVLLFIPKTKRKIPLLIYGAIIIGFMTYIGHGLYIDSIPSMQDNDNLLYSYRPNQPDSKAVKLNEESTLKFSNTDKLPILDGATALYPIYSAFVQAVYPPDKEYKLSSGEVQCTNTPNAYERLINQEVDIIFVAGPSEEQLETAKQKGIELHMTPIGREAFVFFVNKNNKINSLTVDEIKGIYSGKITNWAELGGSNTSIRPYQRNQNSGSQSALQRFMGDTPIIEPEREELVGDMGGIINRVANYKNYKNAFGFSFRFYSQEMVKNNQIKLIGINDIYPTKETIRDNSYPLSNEFYAITASKIGEPLPQESNEMILSFIDWILSSQGQYIIEETGYVSIQ